MFDSYDEGIEKPDPRFFQLALERGGADAATTVHVGDLYHVDVVGARAAAITPVLLDVAGLYPDCDCLRSAPWPNSTRRSCRESDTSDDDRLKGSMDVLENGHWFAPRSY